MYKIYNIIKADGSIGPGNAEKQFIRDEVRRETDERELTTYSRDSRERERHTGNSVQRAGQGRLQPNNIRVQEKSGQANTGGREKLGFSVSLPYAWSGLSRKWQSRLLNYWRSCEGTPRLDFSTPFEVRKHLATPSFRSESIRSLEVGGGVEARPQVQLKQRSCVPAEKRGTNSSVVQGSAETQARQEEEKAKPTSTGGRERGQPPKGNRRGGFGSKGRRTVRRAIQTILSDPEGWSSKAQFGRLLVWQQDEVLETLKEAAPFAYGRFKSSRNIEREAAGATIAGRSIFDG